MLSPPLRRAGKKTFLRARTLLSLIAVPVSLASVRCSNSSGTIPEASGGATEGSPRDRSKLDLGADTGGDQDADVMLDPIMSVWDCAPFLPILREAGGYFGDWSGNATIRGDEALSAAPALLPEILALIGG